MLLFPCCPESHNKDPQDRTVLHPRAPGRILSPSCVRAQVSGREKIAACSLRSGGASSQAEETHVAGVGLVSLGMSQPCGKMRKSKDSIHKEEGYARGHSALSLTLGRV